MNQDPEDRAARAAFRAFVRANHPDVGGDHDDFAAEVTRYRQNAGAPTEDQTRFDVPVSFVTRPKGVTGVVHRVKRWRQRKRRAPRVQ